MSWGIALFPDKPIIYKMRLQRNIPYSVRTIGNYKNYEEAQKILDNILACQTYLQQKTIEE